MKDIKRSTMNYIENIWSRKKALVLGGAVSLLLFFFSLHYMYDGINKKFIMYAMLSILTGLFLALPRIHNWAVNLGMLIVYLAYVPGKLFERTELPLTDMSEIQPGVRLGTILLIILVYAALLLLLQRVRFALLGGTLLLLVFFLINYYVVTFRGSAIGVNDILAAQTGLSVLKNYTLTIEYEEWYSILYFLFFASLGGFIDFPWKGVRYHIGITLAAGVYLLFSAYFWNGYDYYERKGFQGYYWNTSYNERLNGAILGFLVSYRENHMEKPSNYSEKNIKQLAEEIENSFEEKEDHSEKAPNIIMIMNEAWSDLRVLGDIEVDEEYMPFVGGLTENTRKGNLYVEILGGLTANTEFEALTGDSLALLSPTVVPYQLQVNHPVAALPQVLKEQGYQTMAMHPSGANAWNREKVYPYFGFDEFIDVEQFATPYEYVGSFISDECNFNEIIYRYEHRDSSKPFFLFDVTIQNHGGYYLQVPFDVKVTKVAGSSDLDYPKEEVNCYLSLMKITDQAFQGLIEYFEKVDEPVIVCMFGDHQPYLHDEFYEKIFSDRNLTEEEKNQLKYISQYVIWANYDVDWEDYGDVSANYLRSILLKDAGVKLPTYDKFLLNLIENYPQITHFNIDAINGEEEITDYRRLQYNHLLDRNPLEEIFVKPMSEE